MASTQAQDGAVTLPLSPEQIAVVEAADGQLPSGKAFLFEIGESIDIARFIASLDAALRGHTLLRYRPARVEGFRLPRLCGVEGLPKVVLEAQELSIAEGVDAVAAVVAWHGQHRAERGVVDANEAARAIVAASSDGARHMALLFDPLLLDEGSVRLVLGQAFAHYNGEELAGPDFQYPQYIDWRRELERADGAQAGRDYWKRYLGEESLGQPPLLSYRADDAGANRTSLRAVRIIRGAQADRLSAVARGHDTSIEVVLQAFWWALLARLTGAERFVAGWRHDCRADYAVMSSAVGVFEKVLPVIIDVTPDETVAQWLARFAGVAAAHVEQQEYWTLVDAPVSTHHTVGFVASPGLEVGGGLPWSLRAVPDAGSGFELALHVAPVGDALEWSVIAAAGRYPAEAAERLAMQFSTLLATALADPDQRVGDLALVGEEERALLLGLNPAARDLGGQGLLQRIARWAEETPDAPALDGVAGELSYRELVAVVRRKARWLRDLGVKPGTLVALALPRSAELVSTLLAVWQAGGGYLPIEPEWPALRRLAVLDDAGPAVVVHTALPADAHSRAWRDVVMDRADWAIYPDAPLSDEPAFHDTAYVLYTSGSTGKPKGVVIEHAQLLNYVVAVSDALRLRQTRRWGLVSTMAADLGNTALFSALLHGACLVVARPEDVGDAEAFSRFIEAHGVDALKIVPSHLEALLECDQPRLPATIVLGGEAAPRSLLERIRALAPQTAIHNHYGPTETTVGVMVHVVGVDEQLPAVLPLTTVLGNNHIYVLDEALRLVAAGAQGEVYVGGAQVCRGYLNRDATGDFVADPFYAGQRLYRTRDLAWVLPQGGIRLAGRNDDQLKVRGFRVSPAEVEATLLTLPGIRQAVVVPASDDRAAPDLGAFVVAADGVDSQTIKVRLHAALPAHMVPARIVCLEEFPRLANGKVDRQAIRLLAADTGTAHVERPKDPLEYEIAKSMAVLLEREVLGAHEDFFDLGAHSLMVIKLAARLRKQFGVEIAPALVFDHGTPSALACVLRRELEVDTASLN